MHTIRRRLALRKCCGRLKGGKVVAVRACSASREEYGTHAKGLLRYDRATEKVALLPMRDVVTSIARDRSKLQMITDLGIATLAGSGLRRYFVDQTSSSGGPYITEAYQ